MKKHSTIAVWAFTLLAIALLLLIYEKDLLWKIQETTLFLNTSMFFCEQMVVPGGMLTWVGMLFTQLFFYPVVGVLVLCAWWLLLMWLIKRTFRIRDSWVVITIIPVALLLMTLTDMGYWIYVLKLHGLTFIATIGTTAVAALLWAFRLLPPKWHLCTAFILLTCAAGYPLMGIYGLAAPLLMAIWSWRTETKRAEATINSVTALLAVIAIPLLFYQYVYYQTNLANIYYAELPLYYVTEEYQAYYLPFYLLLLYFVVLALWPAGKASPSPLPRKGKQAAGLARGIVNVLPQVGVAAAVCAGVAIFWFKDENFHRELAMQHRMENQDWEGIIAEAVGQNDEPTRAIVMMRNVALARLGRQANEMYFYKNGSKDYNAPFGMRLLLVCGPLMYYQYGMLNYCNRMCIETGVEFGFSPEYLRLMTKCAILNGERQAALKYIKLLHKTLFYSKWARQAEELLNHREIIVKDPEMAPITHMMHYDNVLSSDNGYVEDFIMRRLAESTYKDDPVFQEQALLATLWTKDINQFWQRFYDYVFLHPKDPMPRHLQEAAYLYGKIEDRKNLDRLPFDDNVKNDFNRFTEIAPNYDGADREQAYAGLYPFFGHTYYFDYYVMNQLPEY